MDDGEGGRKECSSAEDCRDYQSNASHGGCSGAFYLKPLVNLRVRLKMPVAFTVKQFLLALVRVTACMST